MSKGIVRPVVRVSRSPGVATHAVAVALTLSLSAGLASADPHPGHFQFVSPVPDARLVSPQETVVLRPGPVLDRGSLDARLLDVEGGSSGAHAGTLVLADDGRTLVFRPAQAFTPGERVRVSLRPGLRDQRGEALPAIAFAYSVAPASAAARAMNPLESLAEELPGLHEAARAAATPARPTSGGACDALPGEYPTITLMASNNPDPGALFIAPFTANFAVKRGDLVVLDNRGMPLFWRSWPTQAWNLTRQPNGLLTFFTQPGTFLAMDSTYTVVDSFKTGNGYVADTHDLQLLPNGHALLMAYDPQVVAMDSIVPGGNPAAIVSGLILQEIDSAKNVVFEWRSWDHFQITDMDSCTGLLTDPTIDYVHGNAIELDTDGNLLLSSRHLNEITKIDRSTGDVIWRMGPHAKNNQFTFVGDPRGFSHQHDIRRMANGHLSLFDNGNCLSPPYSRALEYAVDETNRVATLVSDWPGSAQYYSSFMGNVQHRDDGGTTICLGGITSDPKLVELHADGSVALALGFGSPTTWTYRGLRYPWRTTAFVPGVDSLDLGLVAPGSAVTRRLGITNRLATPLTLGCFTSSSAAFSVTTPVPLTIPAGATDSIDVRFAPTLPANYAAQLDVRAVSDTDLIVRPVTLTGEGSGAGISISGVSAAEGQAGLTPFVFTVSLAHTADTTVTVSYSTLDGTATVAGGDYIPTSGIATIPAGQLSTPITVEVVGDTLPEPDETFSVVLSSPAHGVILSGTGVGVILGDEPTLGVGGDGAPRPFELYPAQPNPSRGWPLLTYDLPRAGRVTLEVFDVRGRRVDTLADGVMPAGRHAVLWRPRGTPTGMYFARLSAGGDTRTRRIALVH